MTGLQILYVLHLAQERKFQKIGENLKMIAPVHVVKNLNQSKLCLPMVGDSIGMVWHVGSVKVLPVDMPRMDTDTRNQMQNYQRYTTDILTGFLRYEERPEGIPTQTLRHVRRAVRQPRATHEAYEGESPGEVSV